MEITQPLEITVSLLFHSLKDWKMNSNNRFVRAPQQLKILAIKLPQNAFVKMKRIYFTVGLLLLLLSFLATSCNNKPSNTIDEQNPVPKSATKKTTIIVPEDTLYKDNNLLILQSEQSTDTLYRFHSQLDATPFEVELQAVKPPRKLNFDSSEFKKRYITAITHGVNELGVNFAGKYCLVSWGCGSPCQSSAIVDMKTGMVYNGLPSAVGYRFKKNSRVLITNPPDSSDYFPKARIVPYPEQYAWTDKKWVKIDPTNDSKNLE